MSSYINHQALVDLTLGKSTDYRDTYDAGLLQGIPHGLNRNPLGLKAGNPPLHGTDVWTLRELFWLDTKGLPQVAVSRVELDYTSVDLIELKSSKLYLNSFSQARFNDWGGARRTLECDSGTCAQGKVSVTLYRLDELEGRPIGHFNGTCVDDQNTTIDNCEFITDYLGNATSDEEVVEETPVSHLLKSNCLITHQPGWDSIQIQYHGRQIDREKLLRYSVSSRHRNEFHEQCVERTFNNLLRFCQPEKLNIYTRYTRRGGLDINPWRSNSDFVPSTTRLARQ